MTVPTSLRRFRAALFAVTTVAVLATLIATPASAERRHARLLKSVPAKDSVVAASPASVQLWFSEPIELSVSRIRLLAADSSAVALGALAQDARVAYAPVTAAIPKALADGWYTVQWTAAARDGHAVKGSFGFSVKSK